MTWGELLNAQYVKNGRDLRRDGGLDCWGFVRAVYALYGIELPSWDGDAAYEAKDSLFANERHGWTRHENPCVFDVVLFDLPRDGWHCGVVMPDKVSFAHCRYPKMTIERLDSQIWARANRGYYAWTGK